MYCLVMKSGDDQLQDALKLSGSSHLVPQHLCSAAEVMLLILAKLVSCWLCKTKGGETSWL